MHHTYDHYPYDAPTVNATGTTGHVGARRRRDLPRRRTALMILALGLSLTPAAAGPAWSAQPASFTSHAATSPARASRLVSFDPLRRQFPEGIAEDLRGHVYVTWKPLQQLVRLRPDGTPTVVATLPGRASGLGGLVGLATAPDGDILGALANTDPRVNGLWLIHPDGTFRRLAALPITAFPNAIAVTPDHRAALVTDSTGSRVYRVDLTNGRTTTWLRDDLLAPVAGSAVPVGANGITFRSAREVVVANTSSNELISVPVRRDGTPGRPSVLTTVSGPDGVVAAQGQLYVAQYAADRVLRISPDGRRAVLAGASDDLDAPVSLLVRGHGRRAAVLVTDSSVTATADRPGVSVVRAPQEREHARGYP